MNSIIKWIDSKNPWFIGIINTFIPGLGQIFLKKWLRGILTFVMTLALFFIRAIIIALIATSGSDPTICANILLIILVIGLFLDGYNAAKKYHKQAMPGMTTPSSTSLPANPAGQPIQEMAPANTGASITLWAQDEATAKSLATDQYYLMGVLMGDNSASTKAFLDSLGKGGSLTYKTTPNSVKGGYNVELTVTPAT